MGGLATMHFLAELRIESFRAVGDESGRGKPDSGQGQSGSFAPPWIRWGGAAAPPWHMSPSLLISLLLLTNGFRGRDRSRALLEFFHQSGTNGILANVVPFLGVAFAIAKAMMEAAGLKGAGIGMGLGEAVFPEAHPLFDGEFGIAWGAEEMEVIGHEEVIAHEPGGGFVFPDLVQGALHGVLGKPAFTVLHVHC